MTTLRFTFDGFDPIAAEDLKPGSTAIIELTGSPEKINRAFPTKIDGEPCMRIDTNQFRHYVGLDHTVFVKVM